jgi:hypothetical protein
MSFITNYNTADDKKPLRIVKKLKINSDFASTMRIPKEDSLFKQIIKRKLLALVETQSAKDALSDDIPAEPHSAPTPTTVSPSYLSSQNLLFFSNPERSYELINSASDNSPADTAALLGADGMTFEDWCKLTSACRRTSKDY